MKKSERKEAERFVYMVRPPLHAFPVKEEWFFPYCRFSELVQWWFRFASQYFDILRQMKYPISCIFFDERILTRVYTTTNNFRWAMKFQQKRCFPLCFIMFGIIIYSSSLPRVMRLLYFTDVTFFYTYRVSGIDL